MAENLMSYETLLFEARDGVACITFNRPQVGNALSPHMARELSDAAIRCDDDPTVRAVVLTGAGKLFCAGGDLGAFATAGSGAKSMIKAMAGDFHMALSRFARMRAPVVAAVNGTAGGAGFSVVMAADLAICTQSAKFTMAYTNAGLSPDGSSTFYMPRKIGDRRTRELMLTNRVLTADEALAWGVVNQVVADGEALPAAMALATKLASGASLAYGAVKTLLNESFEHSLEAQMELEARAIAELVASGDGQEGIKAFLEKRKPQFSGQ
jgi:2-(1,2-epoxy-1,2-dihydrophenyl)acetyl-CoA isomerase